MLRRVAALCLFALSVSCGSESSAPASTTPDAAPVDTGVAMSIDRGVVQDYGSGKPLAGITVTEHGASTITDAKGLYKLDVPKDKPGSLVLSGPDYVKTIVSELSIATTLDRSVPLPALTLFRLGQSALDGFDKTKGIVYLIVRTTGTCASADGGVVTVLSPPGAKLAYFDGKLPDPALTAITKSGEPDIPVVAVYNVPVGSAVTVKIDHPTCKHAAFPVTVAGITYYGRVAVEAGDVQSVIHHYLQ